MSPGNDEGRPPRRSGPDAGEDVPRSVRATSPIPAHVRERERRRQLRTHGRQLAGPARRVVHRGGWGGRG